MSDTVGYIFDVNQFATTAQLKTVIEEMKGSMQEASELVIDRDQRSHLKDAMSILTSGDRTKIDDLKVRFTRFKERFDRGVNVQTAENVDIIKLQFEKFVSVQEEYTYLAKLDPQYTKSEPPRCLQGTRKDILLKIREWTNDFDAPNVLWICAYPGAGKSTIAFTIASELEQSHRMGTIFAFDRKHGTSPSLLWRHVAFSLAHEYPDCRDHIISTLKGNPSVFANMTATEIFHRLVAEPLRQWSSSLANFPRERFPVFVIDALDECGGIDGLSTRARKEVLSDITEWATTLSSHFKLIVTSRVENDIERSFSKISHQPLPISTGDTVSPESTRDIQQYIEYRFGEIATDHEDLTPNWPGKDVVDDLTRRASGVFIWAATALNYIEGFPGNTRLNDVKGLALPPGDVHALYRQVLTKSFSQWRPDEHAHFVKLVGAVVVSQVLLTQAEFAHLLNLDAITVRNVYNGLRPVLAAGDTLRFAHQSFVDFLLRDTETSIGNSVDDVSCPNIFHIDTAVAHHYLVESMFRLMNERLRFNICNIKSSFMRNTALPQSQVENAIDRPLSYACRFWGYHVEQMARNPNMALPHVTAFLREKLLYWLETLAVLGVVSTAAAALACLYTKLQVIEHTEQAVKEDVMMLKDALKFVQYFAPAIAESAPHIYISSLPFAPRSSSIASWYAHNFRGTMSLSCGQLPDWPAEQTVIHAHALVKSVAFSPNGKQVVSGSHDHTIRIWDAETGQVLAGPFNGHTNSVISVAFSPDGKRLVSGSLDCTIRIWDSETGQVMVGQFDRHEDKIRDAEDPRHPSFPFFTDQSVPNVHGWIKGPDDQLLFWVPNAHRLSLHRPSNVAVIGRNETRLDFSRAVFGRDWARCYTPS
ncbi:hypothetical protein OBBRIDRAFT_453518 [Obba rivulosa]|uniref:Nephrocystin 3-like N-terminal domain-containing protein n=1 Tax=Obba rivulosa TaxID=1052685 RepID=A0A8E2AGI8_9APHY|nr:hypothetical protein OBBRIDRAFT_453518 [Obba rivulosa]